jgi:hypothetical protein
MTIIYHRELEQGSPEWLAARCGLLTASEMKLIITSGTNRPSDNDKSRAHIYELLSQRISRYVEPSYVSNDMLRGKDEELLARELYIKHYAAVEEVGFVTNDRWGFTIGYSPDGLVGEDGLIECKSRNQKYQVQTIIENISEETVPLDFAIQIQTGLLVTERLWTDFITYSGGLPMATIRVYPVPELQERILAAADAFERKLEQRMTIYHAVLRQSGMRLIPTERIIVQEMYV